MGLARLFEDKIRETKFQWRGAANFPNKNDFYLLLRPRLFHHCCLLLLYLWPQGDDELPPPYSLRCFRRLRWLPDETRVSDIIVAKNTHLAIVVKANCFVLSLMMIRRIHFWSRRKIHQITPLLYLRLVSMQWPDKCPLGHCVLEATLEAWKCRLWWMVAAHTILYKNESHVFWNCPYLLLPTSRFWWVMVKRLLVTDSVREFKFSWGSEIFSIDFYVLQLQGADVVLGFQWLELLGRITVDYKELYMEFLRDNRVVRLKGEPLLQWQQVQFTQFRRLSNTEAISSCFQLFSFVPEDTTQVEVFPMSPELSHLLDLFKDVFEEPEALPPFRAIDHHIHLLPNSNPVNVKPYRYPHSQKSEIEKLVSDMLLDGVIRPSQSPFSSPVLLVKKKDGTWRFCVDYRALNQVTIKDRFPIPNIDELFDELHGASIFSKIDLRSGFHQIRVHPRDIHKTAFRTHEGHYEFTVMPFGLTNAPSTFQASMNSVCQPFLRKFVIVFFDDILVFSKSMVDHLTHLQMVLSCLRKHSFFAKRSKCSFAQTSIHYLGHIVSVKGVEPDPDKIFAIQQWPTPTTVKTLRGFLGLTGFYRRFVKGYSHMASPLTDLLKKDHFSWSSTAQNSFDTLKLALANTPILALPDFQHLSSFKLMLQEAELGLSFFNMAILLLTLVKSFLLECHEPLLMFGSCLQSHKQFPSGGNISLVITLLFSPITKVFVTFFTKLSTHQSSKNILSNFWVLTLISNILRVKRTLLRTLYLVSLVTLNL
ncbi:uncharacterized protein [Henckelia pumila]|uniref:uncharacterized protein isoform X1 n=1 Tax=Henckelia pumila TaxID=405737 RepID=UPI003C6E7D8D